jgi:hypothetical protein
LVFPVGLVALPFEQAFADDRRSLIVMPPAPSATRRFTNLHDSVS